MYTIYPSCHVKRNTLEAPYSPVCYSVKTASFVSSQKLQAPFYDTPNSVDAFLNQFSLEVFERPTRQAHEVARRKQIIKTLRDIYKVELSQDRWPVFQYSDHTTVLHLYKQ